MNASGWHRKASFGTKVLVPVIAIMVLSLLFTVWLVNRRITTQFQAEAARRLETADTVFRSSESLHARNLLLRFGNLPNDARYKSAFQSKHPANLREALKDLPKEQGVDVALFTGNKAELTASAQRDPRLPMADFQVGASASIKQALTGSPKADTIRVQNRLFDVVSVPVFGSGGLPLIGSSSASPIGVLSIGSEIGDGVAQELSQTTHSQIVLLANGQVVASTVPGAQFRDKFAQLYTEAIAEKSRRTGPLQLVLGNEHYACSVGKFASLSGDGGLGYLLLCSYEQPLQAFHSTQLTVMLGCGLIILLGSIAVAMLVRKLTAPLRHLQAGAEAVGRGDFSGQIDVVSEDECGQLAGAFNVMTGNLKRSREELEQTVTTLKSTQAQLLQSEKLSGMGEFVAGIAHELNNPLTAVMGFSELLVQTPGHPNQARYLEMIFNSSQRCRKIVQNLLAFGRRGPQERKLANINLLVENAVEFLQYQFRTSNIQISTSLAAGVIEAMVDADQMQQVFLNILNNARQAIEAKGGPGRVAITTEIVSTRIRITIVDDGPGIPEEHIAKVFNPFFTTKEIGQGTGLGLSFCYGVVTEHGGTIQVRSKPGEGAAFVVELPLVASVEALPLALPAPPESSSDHQANAGKRVLVIDDEEPILEMVRSELTRAGYQVDVVADGEAALQRVKEVQYDVALCDWKMPGLNGGDVYDRLQVSNPALCQKFLFITGDVISDRIQKFMDQRSKTCLRKPFSLVECRAAIEQTLARGQATPTKIAS